MCIVFCETFRSCRIMNVVSSVSGVNRPEKTENAKRKAEGERRDDDRKRRKDEERRRRHDDERRKEAEKEKKKLVKLEQKRKERVQSK